MDLLRNRFPWLDERLLPHLQQILERLPSEARQMVLSDASFQMAADDDLRQACTICFDFDPAVKILAVVNTMLLREPRYRIILTLADQIARYVRQAGDGGTPHPETGDLLEQWGFGPELASVRQHVAMSDTEGYQVGYHWAIHQNPDYLRQHFGIYADAPDLQTWDDLPDDGHPGATGGPAPDTILENIIRVRPPDYPAVSFRTASAGPLSRQAVMVGILDACRELESRPDVPLDSCNSAGAGPASK